MAITIKLKSFNMMALEKAYLQFEKLVSLNLPIKVDNDVFTINKLGYVRLPKKSNIITILKSPHIDKKARNQLGITTYSRSITLNLKQSNKIDAKLMDFNTILSNFKGVSTKVSYKL